MCLDLDWAVCVARANKEQTKPDSVSKFRSCVKEEVDVPGGLPVPNSPYGLCGRKATLNTTESKKIASEWPFSDSTFHPSIDSEITDLSLPPDWQTWWALSNQRPRAVQVPSMCPCCFLKTKIKRLRCVQFEAELEHTLKQKSLKQPKLKLVSWLISSYKSEMNADWFRNDPNT